MDIDSFFYFSEVAKDLHITRTARRLLISEQTLSNRIHRLEKELGVELLHRKPSISLTYAGEQVLAFANALAMDYANVTDILTDIQNLKRGVIRFGASPLCLNAVLPNILPAFSARYPNVEIDISGASPEKFEPLVLQGELDYAIVFSGKRKPGIIERPLMCDPIYLCVSDELLLNTYGNQSKALKETATQGANVIDFAKLPFCFHSNLQGILIREYFAASDIIPRIYSVSSDTQISLSLCFRGLCACFATHMRLYDQLERIPDTLNIFPVRINGEPFCQKLSLLHPKKRYMAQYSEYFVDLILQYFNNIKDGRIERLQN